MAHNISTKLERSVIIYYFRFNAMPPSHEYILNIITCNPFESFQLKFQSRLRSWQVFGKSKNVWTAEFESPKITIQLT